MFSKPEAAFLHRKWWLQIFKKKDEFIWFWAKLDTIVGQWRPLKAHNSPANMYIDLKKCKFTASYESYITKNLWLFEHISHFKPEFSISRRNRDALFWILQLIVHILCDKKALRFVWTWKGSFLKTSGVMWAGSYNPTWLHVHVYMYKLTWNYIQPRLCLWYSLK